GKGHAQAQLQQYQTAIEDYSEALNVPQGLNNAHKAHTYLSKGRAFLLQGQYQQAIEDFNVALAIPEGLNSELETIAYLNREHAQAQLQQSHQD
ncbi:MAG: tetratricopeptide repeat protein, partial [Gammaproteobacteria bacterium]